MTNTLLAYNCVYRATMVGNINYHHYKIKSCYLESITCTLFSFGGEATYVNWFEGLSKVKVSAQNLVQWIFSGILKFI